MVKGLDGKKILVAEDEEVIAMMLSEYLAEMGFSTIAIVSSVAGALEKTASFDPDIALLDVQLKDGSTSALARILNMRSIPFVVMSRDPAKAKSLSLPTVPPLTRPFSHAELRDALLAALGD